MTIRYVPLLLAVFFTGACAGSGTQIRTVEPTALFQEGMNKLNARKWSDAARAFERFTLEFPTDPRYQEARFHMAEAHFGQKEYITAATAFARLVGDYPGGEYADDAQAKVCESYYELSPESQLDQEYTLQALDQCNALVQFWPNSQFAPRAATMIQELTDKLARKIFEAGDYYYRRKAYDPAILYYEIAARDYPTSIYAPRALARMIQSYRILKYDTEEAETRARLLKEYPESPEAKQLPDSSGLR